MEKVISPFVGFYPDFKHPFSVANSHNTAREYLMDDRREKGIIIKLKDNMFSIRVRIFAPPKADANTVAPCLLSNNDDA